jgi:hypothetical protein
MKYSIRILQLRDGSIDLTVYRGRMRYTENLTPEQAQELAYKLQSFAAGQQIEPYYILKK